VKLSRLDRAACVHALEILHSRHRPLHALHTAKLLLSYGTEALTPLLASVPLAVGWDESRLFRARLALALRAILRADESDFGSYEMETRCQKCSDVHTWRGEPASLICVQESCDGYTEPVDWRLYRYTPLWQSAPAIGVRPPELRPRHSRFRLPWSR
jgi:hypothetical protein